MKYLNLNSGKHLYCVDANQVINAGIKDIFEKHAQDRIIEYQDRIPTISDIESNVLNLNQVVFEVTQNCNLRCKYCTFGGNYTYNRETTKKILAKETAFKTIDFIWESIKNRAKKSFTIGFYGGEPLLHFNTLKEIVNYVKSVFVDWELRFTLTSNGILINDEIIRFFVENRFSMWISLDGPQANHDAKRLLENGQGSFDNVIANLQRIEKYDKEYYENKIHFSVVFSKDLSFKKLIHFFQTNPLVKDNMAKLSFVNQCDTDYYEEYPYSEDDFREQFTEFFDQVVKKKASGEILSGFEAEMLAEIRLLKNKLKRRRIGLTAETCLFDN